jgi:hypothetical protein
VLCAGQSTMQRSAKHGARSLDAVITLQRIFNHIDSFYNQFTIIMCEGA